MLQILEHALSFHQLIVANGNLLGLEQQQQGQIVFKQHPNFRLFLTENPSRGAYALSRNKFSVSLLNHFTCLMFNSYPLKDIEEIVQQRLENRN